MMSVKLMRGRHYLLLSNIVCTDSLSLTKTASTVSRTHRRTFVTSPFCTLILARRISLTFVPLSLAISMWTRCASVVFSHVNHQDELCCIDVRACYIRSGCFIVYPPSGVGTLCHSHKSAVRTFSIGPPACPDTVASLTILAYPNIA